MTFFMKYGPAPCDKNCHQTLFPRFGEGLGTRLRRDSKPHTWSAYNWSRPQTNGGDRSGLGTRLAITAHWRSQLARAHLPVCRGFRDWSILL